MSSGAWTVATVAAVTAAYALGSRRLSSTPLSSAIVFVGCGVLLGPAVLDIVNLEQDAAPIVALLEVTLVLVLFTDALSVRRRDLRTGGFLPGRLLSIGLPLSIGAGWLLAWPLLPGLTMWELALVGTILAPTDAALGKTAMSHPRVPALVRHGLNVESGLNDGMVLPFFILFLAAIPGTHYAQEGVAGVFWRALVLSTAIGLLIGWLGGRLLQWSRSRGWVAWEWRQVYLPAVAAAAYELAVVTEGSGFIAAWVAGFACGFAMRHSPVGGEKEDPDRTVEFSETLGGLLAAISLLVFGAVLLGPALEHLSWRICLYAVLSLTVVRMLPVALSLAGSGLRPRTVAYIGWFGPRGLASVVLALLVVEEHVPGVELLGRVVAITVGLSVLLHGVSAVPLAERYGRWHEKAAAASPDLREGTPVPTPPARRGLGLRDRPEA
ncbi:cation:proton antiporter [Streptomyces sp. NBC_01294]|uniref:cation:proton antiporter n=1 Tax=Streptomyces sp. NBC_01294 TaxID=2903815 RepID=UPI002DDB6EB3|nr:cation:proton antiporter [Streptomyces sp. NBC_01294]WRZ55354.1 cation:proton antiporter [Streptomyces sp. NBC_01294]WRZ61342.1 cation:proton antiporter [Streptomyces sp. NBC_01294]